MGEGVGREEVKGRLCGEEKVEGERGFSEEDEEGDEEKEDEVEEEVEEVLLLLGAHSRQGHDRAITAPQSTHPTCQALARGRHPQRSIANTRWCVLCNRG